MSRVTPATDEAQQLNPHTFGSFLPPKFCTLVEEIDDSSVEDEIHLENVDGKETLKRRLHFSDVETSKHRTPVGDFDKGNNSNGKTLNFIPPMLKECILTMKVEEEDIFLQIKEWETTLIGYIIGDNPYELQMLEYVKKVWGSVELPQFPRLPVGYWSVTALSKVASAIGIPLVTDGFTTKAEKISYARVLIEMDILKVLLDTIVVETPSRPWNQSIEYEWRPNFCNKCIKLGHMENECWFKHALDGKRDKLNKKDWT
ncbi:hypothetical protein KY290_036548 [Solanum tuberosum]|uniref:DUF4283 domain-containing protein n=1 Tax=Solanum tuberosum TaxID=4113 RepID=A0ABQ7TUJ0_SOLTU|nr:hypothetical protein KY289_036039 [Solanum tuberosum]KAH0639277.1 hypothetical protein KY285_035863 [Solanum tuberosum]KAH0737843.1 hypothetical protein KY290_036548 [Solanum tuberosum]